MAPSPKCTTLPHFQNKTDSQNTFAKSEHKQAYKFNLRRLQTVCEIFLRRRVGPMPVISRAVFCQSKEGERNDHDEKDRQFCWASPF